MTQQQKLSRRQQLWRFITGNEEESKPEDYYELPLAGNAIRVVADKKLKERLNEWKEALELLEAPIDEDVTLFRYCTELLDILDTLNTAVRRVAFVYARAGDKEAREAKQLTHGWNHLFGIYKARTLRARFFWGTNETMTDARSERQSINAIVIQKLHMGYENILFKYANDVIAWCFKDVDVRPGTVTVIQTMMPLPEGGGETITGSMGATTESTIRKPNDRPVKNRLKNEV